MSATLAQLREAGMPGSIRARSRRRSRSGFSMIEILFAILIIGILLSLLIVGVRKGIGSVRDTADRQAMRTIAVAVSQFKTEFGHEPPLVEETPAPFGAMRAARLLPAVGGVQRLGIYRVSDATDVEFLDNRNEVYSAADPLRDPRFSTTALAIFLAGGLEQRYSGTIDLPIDGVKGPGFYAPKRDGTFDIPAEQLTGGTDKSKRGKVYEPLVNLGGSAVRLQQDTLGSDRLKVALVDRNGIAIRYYRWLPRASTPPDMLVDLRVPTMVGRVPTGFPIKTPPERDLTQNPALRNATFAIVAAGNNKFFGDEPVNDIRAGLGLSPGMSDDQVRQVAEEDNIVEVGQ